MPTLLWFILILGVTIFVHELGHFIFAKKAGIYVYEFAIGMGPKIFSKKRKNDETIYSIRLIPLGGFVQMAGEEVNDDKKIPKDKKFQSKTWFQKFLAVVAGVLFNFIFAYLLLFLMALIWGFTPVKPIVGEVVEGYPAYSSGVKVNDEIIAINDDKVSSWDDVLLFLQLNQTDDELKIFIKRNNKEIAFKLVPMEVIEDDVIYYKIGIAPDDKVIKGFFPSIGYAFKKMGALFKSMIVVIKSLFTGSLGLKSISGPVGIYSIVGESAKAGFESILYLIAYLSINIGVINLLPIPAFDGGRIVFLFIELITRKRVSPKVENIIHGIGFVFLLGILLLVTFNDILRIFK